MDAYVQYIFNYNIRPYINSDYGDCVFWLVRFVLVDERADTDV